MKKINKRMSIFLMSAITIAIAIVISSCVPQATEKIAVCGTNQAFNSVTRTCYSTVPGNQAPVASNITPVSFAEDTVSVITLSYSDVDMDLATACAVTGLSHVAVTTPCACNVLGVCTVGVKGDSYYYGSAQFSYTVKANEMISNTAIAHLTITNVNNAPTISIPSATFSTNEDTATTVSFTINDVDSTLTCHGSVNVVSSTNLTLIPLSNVVISGTAPNCIATITPALNQFGWSNIVLNVTDGALTTALPFFTLTVNPVNDVPTIVPVDYVKTFVEGNDITLGFKLADVETTMNCSATYFYIASITSTSPALTLALAGIIPTYGGTYPDCTITLPLSRHAYGVSNLTMTVNDRTGAIATSLPVIITITEVNDSPTMTLPAAALTILENSTAAPSSSSFDVTTINKGVALDTFENNQVLTITAVSDTPTLIPNTPCINYTPGPNVTLATPSKIGDYFYDTSTNKCYKSTGLTAATWVLYPSLTVFPDCTSYESFGLGPPTLITATASAKKYLDTKNNKCYIANSTVMGDWSPDNSFTTVHVAFVPVANQSGTGIEHINITLTDNGTTNAVADPKSVSGLVAINITAVNDPPYFSDTITSVQTNEGGSVLAGPFTVDEDQGGTADEDSQQIAITVASDNTAVLTNAGISIFYDKNDNGVYDAGIDSLLSNIFPYTLDSAGSVDVKAHNFYLKLSPIAGVSGDSNITITASDGTKTASKQFSFIVNPVAAAHGGWANISAVGIKTDKNGEPASADNIVCNYNKSTDTSKCDGANSCTGTTSPHSVIKPDAVNVLFWDSANKKCYRSQGTDIFSWIDIKTSCPITRSGGVNFITDLDATPAQTEPIATAKYQYAFDVDNNLCYQSKEVTPGVWTWNKVSPYFVPAKITFSWNPFSIAGSGSDSSVQIEGWNVYRREAAQEYDFVNGFLKINSTDKMTITDPSTRTFTDTTAMGGKVYYYMVRPVDSSHHFATYTPEIFSEVRILAPVANYAFIHRWMVNQEVCNNMHMTTTTTNKVDPTKNYRCPYLGPGGSVTYAGYYDIEKDMLVEINESGCPFTKAPACNASNGCVGIGSPATLGIAGSANNIYYDRSSGYCYVYSGGWSIATGASLFAAAAGKENTALNPPLVNFSEAQALASCSARTTASTLANSGLTGATTVAATHSLPSKKEYIAYSAAPYGMTDSAITDMEQGYSLNIQSRCNSSNANGLESAYTDASMPSTSYLYSIPGTSSSGIRSLYTGSVPWVNDFSTETCSSRYGLQDVYGNVAEWVTDAMTCTNAVTSICDSVTGTDLYYNFDGAGEYYGFDLKTGPYLNANGNALPDDANSFLTSWVFRDEYNDAGKFSFPLGMPIYTSISNTYVAYPYLLDIGPSAGITTAQLHEDGIIVNALATYNGSTHKGHFAQGGSYLSGDLAGRYSSELVPDTTAAGVAVVRPDIGFRCYIPIVNGNYPTDTLFHPYSPYY